MTCDRLEQGDLLGHLGETMDPHIQECDDCQERAGQYSRLAAALAQDSSRPLPDGWKQRTLDRLHRERAARRRRPALAGGLTTAVAVAVMVVMCRVGDRPPSVFAARVEHSGGAWRGHHRAHRGDTWHISVPPSSADHSELWIYLNARELVMRCSAVERETPDCRHDDGAIEATVELRSNGQYDAFWLESPAPLPAPGGRLDDDLEAARNAGGSRPHRESVDVN